MSEINFPIYIKHILSSFANIYCTNIHDLYLLFSLFSGYMVMSDSWFTEFVFEIVVDKKFVSEEVLAVAQVN